MIRKFGRAAATTQFNDLKSEMCNDYHAPVLEQSDYLEKSPYATCNQAPLHPQR